MCACIFHGVSCILEFFFWMLTMSWRILLLFICHNHRYTQSISISRIYNGQFYLSNSTSQLIIVSNVPSIDACVCQCNMYSTCSLANYDGVLQKCSLFSAARWEGRLQLSAISQKNTVIIFTQTYPTSK